jgi:dTDP-4-dehydrorhamnose reductase
VFAALGHTVRPLTRNDVDLTQPSSIRAAVESAAPNFVVNAAAYNLVDKAESEPEAAYAINGLAVCAMAQACRDVSARLLHFSTDYVFDGDTQRPYTEADIPRPTGAYGVSKLAGELYARAYIEEALIIRTCGVFGPAGRHTPRGNFPETMLRLAAGGKPIRVVNDAVVSPTYAPALAQKSAALALAGAGGVFHIGGGQPITWYNYARQLFECAGLHPTVEPVDRTTFATAARRPVYSALDNSKADALGPPMPQFRQSLADFLAKR